MRIKLKDIPLYYSSSAIKQEAISKFLHRRVNLITLLSHIAVKNLSHASKLMKKALLQHKPTPELLLFDAEINLLLNNRIRFEYIIERVKLPFYTSKAQKALYYYLLAQHELYMTDMKTASEQCSKALRIYERLGFTYEQGKCYFLLAQIYRIAGITDIAYTMLREAQKIYKTLDIKAKLTEIEAYFGLIELGLEHYDIAIEYLTKASKMSVQFKFDNTSADINNWLGLVFFLNNQVKKAENHLKKAYKQTQTKEGKIYASEMLARLYFKNKNYAEAEKYIKKALLLAEDLKSYAHIFEITYLKAELHYAQEQYDICAKLLTRLIQQKTPASTTYYPANAYTLLGLVKLKANDLETAQTLFKQAVDLERSRNRLKGVAIDYNNLAELAHLKGQREEEYKYLNQALEYAKSIEDKELSEYLRAKLKA